MKITPLGLFLALSIAANAQYQPSEFGHVSLDEMKMEKYAKDTSATALILFDKGDTNLDDNLRVTFRRHVRIKFFSRASISRWANQKISLDKTNDGLSKLKAATYNLENGKIVQTEMDDKSIFKTKVDRWTNEVSFTLPNVKDGSVIEFSYTVTTAASLLPGWQFQQNVPSLWSEYEVRIPRIFTFDKEMRGFLPITKHETKNDGDYERFILTDVPAFKEEPFTKNSDDYVSKIVFHLNQILVPGNPVVKFNKTWAGIVRDLLEQSDFGQQIRFSGFLKGIAAEITAGKESGADKISAVYDYVKGNIAWNKIVDAIPDRPFKKVLDEKSGSSSEINLLLVALCQKSGLNAFPVLLSTRNHGMIRPFNPRFNQFNYVICLVKSGDKNILLDGTDAGLPMKALPKRCLNGEGLVVSKDNMEWIPLVSMRSKKSVMATCKLDEEGQISGDLTISTDGIDASEVRSSLKELGQEKYVKDFVEGKSWELSKSTFENIDNAAKPAKEIYSISVADHAQVAGPVIYLNPYLFTQMKENIFKAETRLYPVDYSTPFEEVYMASFQIPETFAMEEQPKPKVISLPANAGKFVHSVSQTGNTINFVSQLIVNKSLFNAEEYPTLREFYNQIVAKEAEQIVLKKK